jgi:hypothetical protein
MQTKPSHLAYPVIKRLITARQGLQGEYLTPCLRTDRNAVSDGMPQQ